MDYDLLFTLIHKHDWKTFSKSGYLETSELEEIGYITCFEGKFVEQFANSTFSSESELLLLVLDPLRIHQPIKKEKTKDLELLHVQGKFSIDAIIDRINIQNIKGEFRIRIKHFD